MIVLIWPGVTTIVVVACLGVAIIVYGFSELVEAFTGGIDGSAGSRVWSAVIGIVAIIGGVAIFPTQWLSTVTVGIVIGAVVESGNRVIRALVAVLPIVAGLAVLVQPGLSLVILVAIASAWMVAAGMLMVGAATHGRRRALAAG